MEMERSYPALRGRQSGRLLRRDRHADRCRILQGKEGVVIVKTNMAILVAHYPETVQPGSAANTVEQLADYLVGVGY